MASSKQFLVTLGGRFSVTYERRFLMICKLSILLITTRISSLALIPSSSSPDRAPLSPSTAYFLATRARIRVSTLILFSSFLPCTLRLPSSPWTSNPSYSSVSLSISNTTTSGGGTPPRAAADISSFLTATRFLLLLSPSNPPRLTSHLRCFFFFLFSSFPYSSRNPLPLFYLAMHAGYLLFPSRGSDLSFLSSTGSFLLLLCRIFFFPFLPLFSPHISFSLGFSPSNSPSFSQLDFSHGTRGANGARQFTAGNDGPR